MWRKEGRGEAETASTFGTNHLHVPGTEVYLYLLHSGTLFAQISSCAHRSHKRVRRSRQRKAVLTHSPRFGLDPCSVSGVACAQKFSSTGVERRLPGSSFQGFNLYQALSSIFQKNCIFFCSYASLRKYAAEAFVFTYISYCSTSSPGSTPSQWSTAQSALPYARVCCRAPNS